MKQCLITDLILDKLGFTEYQDGSGDYGKRALFSIDTPPYNNQNRYKLIQYDEKDDMYDGYALMCDDEASYCDGHYSSGVNYSTLYFIHELYQDIVDTMPNEFVLFFVEKCKPLNLYPYIKSYLNENKSNIK